MIKSMTGFGQAVGGHSPLRWSIEIRSWNHRFFDCSTRLPGVLSGLEDRVREFIRGRVKRGKVSVSVSLKSKPTLTNGLVLDEEKIRFYVRALKRVQKKHGLAKGPIDVHSLLAIPNLFMVDQKERSADEYWPAVKRAMDQATRKLLGTRAREGKTLEADMKKRLRLILSAIGRIEPLAEEVPMARRERLLERVAKLAKGVALDSGKLEQEVALFAERADITEEVVRARHHVTLFESSLKQSGETGKKLDFIAQELYREVNTMGSKAQNAKITTEVIQIKSELDKIREQIQNVE